MIKLELWSRNGALDPTGIASIAFAPNWDMVPKIASAMMLGKDKSGFAVIAYEVVLMEVA